jgi:putative two-component system response regulator
MIPTLERFEETLRRLHRQRPGVALHCERTALVAGAYADLLDMPIHDRRLLVLASNLHDVGKINTPLSILNKPSALDNVEIDEMRKHALDGFNIVHAFIDDEPSEAWDRIAQIVCQHHERFTGGGYPYGLAGLSIDPLARALSVIDAYTALTEDRSYHAAVSDDVAMREIQAWSGRQFDPNCVAAFTLLMSDSVLMPPKLRSPIQ